MRAGLRFGIAAWAAALALGPVPVLAQSTAPATNTAATTPPEADTIGPRELQNFSLNGTVTRPAPSTPDRTTPLPRSGTTPTAVSPHALAVPARERPASRPAAERPARGPSVTTSLPPADALSAAPTPAPAIAPGQGFEPALTPTPAADLSEEPRGSYIPWLLALLLLGGSAGYYVWRQRSQPRYATSGGVSELIAAAPLPLQRTPPPRPAPPPPPAAAGIVATRLRPWLEIEFTPGRCVIGTDKATIQFAVAVFNSGSAPARDVLVEASMFNAGSNQDEEIGAFFAHPIAKGNRISSIPPLKRIQLKSEVSLSRAQMRQFEVAGRQLFVPLIGFNALYRWTGGDGQTSASYLVGRDTQAEKMAPLRLDLGPRIFRGLGARQHIVGVRR
ncbi:MAG: hypothetical protein ABI422_03840 [Sphingomicrobium sp.]